ncbi:E3 ubiquitin-protein ligase TRIM38-like [Sorex fumeus]|uniref:E3 ubiquitin-protein ligase TRIM38-like n=1 Tax=Sorex fumeus TaxID=62283 RepID=UPI0024ACE7C5|nr:E3 ubiquitin-protein ligase TRIM38-like [Sorex fumeus]
MASATITKKLREEVTCPICLELMTEPVNINCGHSYCLVCIVGFTENRSSETSSPGTFHCPQCREPFKSDSIWPNKHLTNIIETIKETEHERLCEKYEGQLHLFCKDGGQFICLHCEHSPQHKGHVTALVEDACQGYREQIRKAVTKLKVKESKYMRLKQDTTQKISSWEEKIKHEEERIHSTFTSLRTFLHLEEEFYMCQLKKEKEQKLKSLQDNVAYLDNKLQELRNSILELDKEYHESAQNLLQDIKHTLGRNSPINMDTPKDVSLEVHNVCNVSELYFNVRKMLKRYQVNVTLDPDTAHQELDLSDNQRRVHNIGELMCRFLQRPQTPGGFTALPSILGHERFTSGRHYFEVDVREGTEWGVGVCLDNVPRDTRKPRSGFWIIKLRKNKRSLALSTNVTPLLLRNKLEVVGIILDCDAGLVSFYNATTGSHIYTFPKASFSHALRPYFQVHERSSLFLISSNE